jgi:hypothetical protein
VKDQLAVVGEGIPDSELVRISLKGFTKEWKVIVKCVMGREKLPNWSRFWDEFTQEEIREGSQERQWMVQTTRTLLLWEKAMRRRRT